MFTSGPQLGNQDMNISYIPIHKDTTHELEVWHNIYVT